MDIPKVNQKDHGPGAVDSNAFCLASCYLAIAQYFGHDVTMRDLLDNGAVEENGSVNNTGGYFNVSSKKPYNAANVIREIDKGNPVIIKGESRVSEHYVVAYDYSGSTIKIMDPWGGVFGNLGSTTLKTASSYTVCTN